MPDTNASGWAIRYETLGDPAAPPLIMILGLSHRLAHWGRLPEMLSERLFVVTFDCRGMGASERRDEAYTLRDEVRDITAVMDATGLESAHVYGRSRGGMLAQELVLRHSPRVRSLILSGTTDRGPESTGSTERVERAMHFTPEMTRDAIFAAQDEAMASPGWRERDPEAFAYCLATDLEAPPRRFAVQHQQAAFADWTSDGRLGSITSPTLVLCGEDDGMVPPDNSRRLATAIPNARLQIIPQCGHLPMLEQPEAVARVLFAFLGV